MEPTKTTIITWGLMKHIIDWSAFVTALGYTAGLIASHILGILSGTWLTMQIFSWIRNKKWRKEVK